LAELLEGPSSQMQMNYRQIVVDGRGGNRICEHLSGVEFPSLRSL